MPQQALDRLRSVAVALCDKLQMVCNICRSWQSLVVWKAAGEAADLGYTPGTKDWAGNSQCAEGCRPSTKYWASDSQSVEGCRAVK